MAYILIVDDSTELLEMYQVIFNLHQFDSVIAANKTILFNELKNRRPDIILLDVMLNGQDGRDICKELKTDSHYKDIPVILMSATSTKLSNYKEHLANDILEKPFDIDVLIRKVKALLN